MSMMDLLKIIGVLAAVGAVIFAAKSANKRYTSQSDAGSPSVRPSLDVADRKEYKAEKVVIADINMPFESMVMFMVKWALASIPALIILSILGFAVMVFLGAITGRV